MVMLLVLRVLMVRDTDGKHVPLLGLSRITLNTVLLNTLLEAKTEWGDCSSRTFEAEHCQELSFTDKAVKLSSKLYRSVRLIIRK